VGDVRERPMLAHKADDEGLPGLQSFSGHLVSQPGSWERVPRRRNLPNAPQLLQLSLIDASGKSGY
jgi:hypothetical protein